jgi:hypothetical protein
MIHALEIRFLLPIPVLGPGEENDGNIGRVAADFFHKPDALHAEGVEVQNTRVSHAVRQQRLGFLRRNPVQNPVLFATQRRPDRLGQFRVIGEHQQRSHVTSQSRGCLALAAFSAHSLRSRTSRFRRFNSGRRPVIG